MTIKREILNLFNIIAVPKEVYLDINSSPRWRMPAVLLFIISPLIGFFIIPAAIEPLRRIYEESFDTRTAEIALQTSTHYFTIINVAFEPLMKIIRWVILSAAIYFLIFLYRRNISSTYKKVFSITAYGEIIFHLMGVLTVLVIYIRGIHQISDPSELTVFKGINFFLDKDVFSKYLYKSLDYVNPFSIWYIALVSRGINILTGLHYGVSLVFVSISWCIWILVELGESFLTKKILDIFF